MTENKTILFLQRYNDRSSLHTLFEKMIEDLGDDVLFKEYKNIITKCFKNSAFVETCNDLCSVIGILLEKSKEKEKIKQEIEKIKQEIENIKTP